MKKKEMIKKYGENMRDLWQVIEALLDDVKAAAWQEGYDEGYDCRIDEDLGRKDFPLP